MQTMKAGQLARTLGISARTLREWEKSLNVEVPRNELGHRIYNEEWIAYFKNVGRLFLEEDCEWDEIIEHTRYPGQSEKKVEPVRYQQLPLLVY